MNKKIILASVLTIIIVGIGISISQSVLVTEKYSEVFYLDATFYSNKKLVKISFDDHTQKNSQITLEILGMEESFQKQFVGSHFEIDVPFEDVPKYGWKSMPVVVTIQHPQYGKVGIKTEVHNEGEPPGKMIFSEM